jgi:hypothetical protein
MSRPRSLMMLPLSVKPVGLEMGWGQPDVLSMGGQISGSECQGAV